jgi:WD40 repeat protein
MPQIKPAATWATIACAVAAFSTSHGRALAKEPSLVVDAHNGSIMYIAWSVSKKHYVTCGSDKNVILWKASDYSKVHELKSHEKAPLCACFLDGDTKLAVGAMDGHVSIWDVDSGQLTGKTLFTGAYVQSLTYSPDAKTVLACDGTKEVMSQKRRLKIRKVLLKRNLATMSTVSVIQFQISN